MCVFTTVRKNSQIVGVCGDLGEVRSRVRGHWYKYRIHVWNSQIFLN